MDTVVPPKERECERCGRHDVWDDEQSAWIIVTDEEGNREAGTPHCLHEWDINGTYNPLNGDT